MSDRIKVSVYKYPDRTNLVMGYDDPITGKRTTRSAKTPDETEAIRAAAVWEDELNSGRYQAASKVTWQAFRKRYEEEHLATLSVNGRRTAKHSLDTVERLLDPDKLCKVNASALSTLQTKLRQSRTAKRGGEMVTLPPIKETSVATVLRHIKAALNWAVTIGMLSAVPKVKMPKVSRGRKMKGGALVGEQFDRMLAAVPKVRKDDAAEWQRYLTGLWLSGLRLTESVDLSWIPDAPFAVDLSGRYPRFRIKGEAQKSGRDELLPMTPDFAEFISQTPEAERHGRVFKLNQYGTTIPLTAHNVGKNVDRIGKKSRVVVNADNGKTATAHDLRRTFGTRWAKRVMPAILRKLMRHTDIQTTMQYYVDLDADEMAADLWAKFSTSGAASYQQGNNQGNMGAENPHKCRENA